MGFRFAAVSDVHIILTFIRELASFEGLLDQVVADEATLVESLFGSRPSAEVVLADLDGEAVGFALFFHNFSTFLGRPGLYLEDLYVRPHARGRGIGKRLMSFLARIAVQRKCGRFEWWVLDWNQRAIEFYRTIGAIGMDEWTVQRVTGTALTRLAGMFP